MSNEGRSETRRDFKPQVACVTGCKVNHLRKGKKRRRGKRKEGKKEINRSARFKF